VFNSVAVITAREALLGMLERVKSHAYGGFFDGMEGKLKAMLVSLPDHFSEYFWLWMD
jgi:hypothetical protein